MTIDLPLLHYYARKNGSILKDYALILIQHLLQDTVSLIEAFNVAGVNSENMIIVGIPYSSKEDVVQSLRNEYQVITPESEHFDDHVRDVIDIALNICRQNNKKLIVVEDGGYAVPLLHQEFEESLKLCKGAVEQTTRGIWRDDPSELKIIEELKIPVLSIPHCFLKQNIEGPEIGKAVVKNVDHLLSKMGQFISGKRALVISYGTVGSNIAESLENQRAIVSVSEIDAKKLLVARLRGYDTDSLMNSIRKNDLIIGATGKTSIGMAELLAAKNNTVLVSASSKRVEIDVDELENLSKLKTRLEGIGTEYELINGNKILLLADGYPVNFYGSDSVPDWIIDIILTELFVSVVKLAQKDFDPGIHECPIDEDEIAEFYHGTHFS
jgi:adenosylhomocysteinase